MEIIPFASNCLTVLCMWQMCRDLPLYMLVCALPIADWLSQCIHIVGTSFGQHEMSSRKLWSHSASSPALSKAINLDYIVDLAIHVCLDDFHDIATPPIVNIYPLVDFESLVSDIQFASLYHSSTAGYLK